MADRYMHEVLTPAVLDSEERYYGRRYARAEDAPEPDALREQECEFIESRDSFYLGSVTEIGWPYVQHRGGPKGFLRVAGPDELLFADYGGNRQLVSAGSIQAEDRVSLFLMDYPGRRRLKLLGHAEVLDAREYPDLIERSMPPDGHGSAPERIFRIRVLSYDWNCPKFITPRFTLDEVREAIEPLKARVAELEAELALRQS
ncbi:MAG: pyridoxamine 5'-phosphate oxidase family protein [Verrucomicrobiota bacterium]